MTWVPSRSPVRTRPRLRRDGACSRPILDQRWYMFQKMGPAPSPRSGHAMASMGTRVFVLGGLGGESLNTQKPEDPTIVHVLDTSKSAPLRFSFPDMLLTVLQNISSTRIPTSLLQRVWLGASPKSVPSLFRSPGSRMVPRIPTVLSHLRTTSVPTATTFSARSHRVDAPRPRTAQLYQESRR